jgi:hypothetical protein
MHIYMSRKPIHRDFSMTYEYDIILCHKNFDCLARGLANYYREGHKLNYNIRQDKTAKFISYPFLNQYTTICL